jgi:hypothetical protein
MIAAAASALSTRRALGVALSTGDDDDHVRRTIADKLIEPRAGLPPGT